MSAGLEISDYGKALQAIDNELEMLEQQELFLLRRKSVLTLAKNKILSDVRQLASVHIAGQGGSYYGLRRVG